MSADNHVTLAGNCTREVPALAVIVTRFWALVDKSGGDDACWPWTGYSEGGYGQFFYEGSMRVAPRLALSFWSGEQPSPELDTCHSCNNPPCCNPRHLRFDTRKSNVADAIAAGTFRGRPPKVTAEDVRVIRERVAAGAVRRDLAAQYGVTPSAITSIITGRTWPKAAGPIQTGRVTKRPHRKVSTNV